MAKKIKTHELVEGSLTDENVGLWVYCGLDCCVTYEVWEQLQPLVDACPNLKKTYEFERALQNPALDMMLRGFRIDLSKRDEMMEFLSSHIVRLQEISDRLCVEGLGIQPINPASPKQLSYLFYEVLKVPPVIISFKGVKRVSTNREALEKMKDHTQALPFVSLFLALRDYQKQLGTLQSGIDPDGRIRCSYNVAGTDTGRWSSSKNAFGTGSNLQNISPKLRSIFVSDPGMKMAYIDLEQAESRCVGVEAFAINGHHTYLDACEGGDLHTTVAMMVWRDLTAAHDLVKDGKVVFPKGTGWSQTDKKQNKAVADLQKFYRDFSYRDMAKRGGHGTNYYGQPFTMARHLKVDTKLMVDFQERYFQAFPEIRQDFHADTARQLQTKGKLTTLLGRTRNFFARLNDPSTLRQAIAYRPQSMTADLLNDGMYWVWKLIPQGQLLAQIHDAIIIQYPEHLEDELIPRIQQTLRREITVRGRKFSIPCDCKVGWNWGYFDALQNPDGLKGYSKNDARQRVRLPHDSELSLLFHGVHEGSSVTD